MQDLQLLDWQRLLIGNAPWIFLIEVMVRTAAIYLFLLFSIQFLGKRTAAQLSILEMAVLFITGAAIGGCLQTRQQGLVPALAALVMAFICQKSFLLLSFKKPKFDALFQGEVNILLKDGRLLMAHLKAARLPRNIITAELRAQGIQHLGELRRIYFEPSGDFSLVLYQNAKPGLSICPDQDDKFCTATVVRNCFVCVSCGSRKVVQVRPHTPCVYCAHKRWESAVSLAA
jgi:uncharacterized membrane protein YcaP (DUF421 family)